jgi:intracellular sulfur oxidation DsrE/DsrF family protein
MSGEKINKEVFIMKTKTRIISMSLFLSICLLFAASSNVFAGDYGDALKGVKSIKALYDFRIGNTKSAALHLKLIHQTYKDKEVMDKKPVFVVVFIGPSVKLISKNREGFSPEEQATLSEIAGTISEMSKDGIKLEICLVAAKVFGVDPATVLPEIKAVPNGWISEIGYQAQGYSLIPA